MRIPQLKFQETHQHPLKAALPAPKPLFPDSKTSLPDQIQQAKSSADYFRSIADTKNADALEKQKNILDASAP